MLIAFSLLDYVDYDSTDNSLNIQKDWYPMLRSNQNLFNQITDLIGSATEEIIVFSPYVKYDALLKLLSPINSNTHVTIITSWKPHDVAYGSSDLSIYPFCKDNDHTLLINNQIHLKSILIDNMTKAYTGSANITSRGLGYNSAFNYEIGTNNCNRYKR